MHLTSPTEKVSIRALNQSDLELIVEIWTNPLTRKYLGGPVSVADASDRFAKMLKNNYNNSWFFVVEYADNKAGLISIDNYHETDAHEISYQFLPQFWGKGIAFSALNQVMQFARSVGTAELYAETQELNIKSVNLLTKLGMLEKNRIERFGAQQIVFFCRLLSSGL
jgi:RimJ/RimL family protein N-acetyltransferase